MKFTKRAIFPGSFDNLHSGHIDIIKRASKLFDVLYVVVSVNADKKYCSTLLERFKKVKANVDKLRLKNVKVICNDGLTVDVAKKFHCKYIVRSIRSIDDCDYELDIANTNRHLNPAIETIIFVASKQYKNISSSKLKKIKYQLKKKLHKNLGAVHSINNKRK